MFYHLRWWKGIYFVSYYKMRLHLRCFGCRFIPRSQMQNRQLAARQKAVFMFCSVLIVFVSVLSNLISFVLSIPYALTLLLARFKSNQFRIYWPSLWGFHNLCSRQHSLDFWRQIWRKHNINKMERKSYGRATEEDGFILHRRTCSTVGTAEVQCECFPTKTYKKDKCQAVVDLTKEDFENVKEIVKVLFITDDLSSLQIWECRLNLKIKSGRTLKLKVNLIIGIGAS